MECTICHKKIEYYAIGNNCNHILCTLCRVRISYKLSDFSCPLCKTTSEFHVFAKLSFDINDDSVNNDNTNGSGTNNIDNCSNNDIKLFSDYK